MSKLLLALALLLIVAGCTNVPIDRSFQATTRVSRFTWEAVSRAELRCFSIEGKYGGLSGDAYIKKIIEIPCPEATEAK